MFKLVSPHGWDFGERIVSPIKIGSRGLIGNDRSDFIKRASHAFLSTLDNVKPASDEEPVHMIALGATEGVGANRNGDGFKEAACKKYHNTFVKFARWYRSHLNKDPKKSYGIVKASAYHDRMKRVELVTFLNKDKSAAERNGGLVADKEMEKLARGEDIPVSMSCKISFDRCSYCGNEAKTRDDYCTADTCKAGGCSENLGKVIKVGGDLHHLHVDNPHPLWFDISNVFRPADRIAYGASADWLQKAAAALDGACGGAEAAETLGLTVSSDIVLAHERMMGMKIAALVENGVKLAAALHVLEQRESFPAALHGAFTKAAQGDFDFQAAGFSERAEDNGGMLYELARNQVILPLRDFARLTKRAELAAAAASQLPGLWGTMLADGSLAEKLQSGRGLLSADQPLSLRQKSAAAAAGRFSLLYDSVCARAVASAATGLDSKTTFEKVADVAAASDLAKDYIAYKSGAMAAAAETAPDMDHFLLTARLAIAQNRVI